MNKPKVTINISDKDFGFKKYLENSRKLKKGPYVKVGVQGSEAGSKKKYRKPNGSVVDSDKLTLVQVAAIHEFGSEDGLHPPQRSFIFSTTTEKAAEIHEYSDKLVAKYLSGDMDLEKALGLLGQKVQSLIQRKFVDNEWPGLAPSTLGQRRDGKSTKFKGHKPLIDTGQLRRSITYVGVPGGDKDGD